MKIYIHESALQELETFRRSGNKALLTKIKKLLEELQEHPETGTGKPEALKEDLSGFWSRRINGEHRLLYKIDEPNEVVQVYRFKGHYNKKKKHG